MQMFESLQDLNRIGLWCKVQCLSSEGILHEELVFDAEEMLNVTVVPARVSVPWRTVFSIRDSAAPSRLRNLDAVTSRLVRSEPSSNIA